MKRLLFIYMVLFGLIGCDDPYKDKTYKINDEYPSGTYLSLRENDFSEWVTILKYADMYNAINQATATLTVFAPTNEAVKAFYAEKGVSSIQELGEEYAKDLVNYHLMKKSIERKTFLLGGRLTNPTLGNDFLTVTFDKEETFLDKVKVSELSIETTNGYVYVLDGVMHPITETLYDRINSSDYSIFRSAVDATGLNTRLSTVYDTVKTSLGLTYATKKSFTLFPVADSIYAKSGITTLAGLVSYVEAESDYTSVENKLRQYVSYHMVPSTYFAEDLFGFTATDTILLWNTQATNQVMSTRNVDDVNYINYSYDTISDVLSGIKLINADGYTLAKNGVVHPINDIMPIYSPDAVSFYWDLGDYAGMESIINDWGVANGYGECYQQYLYEQKGKIFYVDITDYDLDFFTYKTTRTATSANPAVGYCVLGNLKDTYRVNYFGSSDGTGQAYKDDVITLNLGYMGKATFKTPTILKGKYKVTIYQGYQGSTYSFFLDGQSKCKFTMDGTASTVLSLPTSSKITTNNGMDPQVLWEEIEFSESGTHELGIVFQDPRASTTSDYRLLFDYVKFEPVE